MSVKNVRKKKTQTRAVKFTGENFDEVEDALELVYSSYTDLREGGNTIFYYDKKDNRSFASINKGQWLVTSNKGENGKVKVLYESDYLEKYEEV